jgi:two-component system response regulator AtoC
MGRHDLDLAEATGMASTGISEDWTLANPVSPALRALDRMVREIAPTDIPVLLTGESGSGKDLVALRIHRLSRRGDGPFLKVACTALTPVTIEQMSHADEGARPEDDPTTGSIFFDEVCDLDQVCQPKLLHFLPDGDSTGQGHCLGPRVISSTERNLEQEIRQGRFRQELYYRLKGVCLRLPPLRACKEDIPGLIGFFLSKHAPRFGRPKPACNPKTLAKLMDYSWPGNVRQLENVAKNIVALGDEQLALGDLEAFGPESELQVRGGSSEIPSLKQAARAAARQAERELILKALGRTHWNRKRAAKELQVSYKALLYKLKQIGMEESGESKAHRGAQQ